MPKKVIIVLCALVFFQQVSCLSGLPTKNNNTNENTILESPAPVTDEIRSPVTLTPTNLPHNDLYPTSAYQKQQDQLSPDVGFKIVTSAEVNGETLQGVTYFLDDYAVELDSETGKASVVFDLENMFWRELSSDQVITLQDSEQWANASAEQTIESLKASQNDDERRFVKSLLEPDFEVTRLSDSQITMESEFMVYEITSSQDLPLEVLAQLFLYDRLNAYRKSMVERKFPPFVQLEVTEELYKLSAYPNEIIFTFKTQNGDMIIRTISSVEKMSNEEQDQIQSIISK